MQCNSEKCPGLLKIREIQSESWKFIRKKNNLGAILIVVVERKKLWRSPNGSAARQLVRLPWPRRLTLLSVKPNAPASNRGKKSWNEGYLISRTYGENCYTYDPAYIIFFLAVFLRVALYRLRKKNHYVALMSLFLGRLLLLLHRLPVLLPSPLFFCCRSQQNNVHVMQILFFSPVSRRHSNTLDSTF